MQTLSLPIALDESLATPLYEQLTQSLKDAILSGQLPHGTVIDSARKLSKKLGVSRHTVMHSMEILVSQGYIYTDGTLTTIAVPKNANITFESGPVTRDNGATPPNSKFGERVIALGHIEDRSIDPLIRQPFEIPFAHWKRLTQTHARDTEALLDSTESEGLGYQPMRSALSDYLGRSRSVFCDPDQIAIFPNTTSALDMITRLLFDGGTDIAVENPTWQRNIAVFRANNLDIYPLDVDIEGVCLGRLGTLLTPPKMVYVTPSHNNPSGMPMSLNRRRALLSWATENDAIVIENDEDSHYCYTTRPMPSLQGLDSSRNRVIYVSSFGSILSPLAQLAFAVVPKKLCSLFASAMDHFQQSVPLLEQLVLTDLLNSGFLERHIHKSSQSLAHRRRSLVIALTKAFKRNVRINNESVGTCMLIHLETGRSEARVKKAAQLAGLALDSTSAFYMMQNPPHGEFIISFANVNDDIEVRVNEFARLLCDIS